MGVDLYHGFFSFRLKCVSALVLPHQEERDDPPIPGEALALAVHEAGRPAAVHHDGVVPPGGRQQVSQGFRLPLVPADVVSEAPVLRADGRPGRRILHVRPTVDRADFFAIDDEVDALHIVGVAVGNPLHPEILRRVPADSPRRVIRLLVHFAVRFQVAGGGQAPQEDRPVADNVPAGLGQHPFQVRRGGAEPLRVEIDPYPLEVGERDGSRPRGHVSASCLPLSLACRMASSMFLTKAGYGTPITAVFSKILNPSLAMKNIHTASRTKSLDVA